MVKNTTMSNCVSTDFTASARDVKKQITHILYNQLNEICGPPRNSTATVTDAMLCVAG